MERMAGEHDRTTDATPRAARRTTPCIFDDPGDNIGPKSNDLWKPVIAAVKRHGVRRRVLHARRVEFIIAAEHATFFDPHATYGMTAASNRSRCPEDAVRRDHARLVARRASACRRSAPAPDRAGLGGRPGAELHERALGSRGNRDVTGPRCPGNAAGRLARHEVSGGRLWRRSRSSSGWARPTRTSRPVRRPSTASGRSPDPLVLLAGGDQGGFRVEVTQGTP